MLFVVETEYTELQRQYRIVESEKKAYTEKTQTQLKKLECVPNSWLTQLLILLY